MFAGPPAGRPFQRWLGAAFKGCLDRAVVALVAARIACWIVCSIQGLLLPCCSSRVAAQRTTDDSSSASTFFILPVIVCTCICAITNVPFFWSWTGMQKLWWSKCTLSRASVRVLTAHDVIMGWHVRHVRGSMSDNAFSEGFCLGTGEVHVSLGLVGGHPCNRWGRLCPVAHAWCYCKIKYSWTWVGALSAAVYVSRQFTSAHACIQCLIHQLACRV